MAFRRARVAVFLAGRSLVRGNASVSLMSIAMMTAVFVSVMFLPSLITGASTVLNRQVVDTLTGDLSISSSSGGSIDHAGTYLDRIDSTDGVAAATGIRRVGNEISYRGDSLAQGIDAIDPTTYAQVFTTPRHLIEGSFLAPGDAGGIVLGVGVAGADRTALRTYSSSLKHVHVGDRVDVSLVGGDTHTFVVRGIYENGFPLSDQGAFITTKAADELVPTANLADQMRSTFAALDDLTTAVAKAAGQADSLAAGVRGLSAATGTLAASAQALDTNAASVSSGAGQLAASAQSTADSAAKLASAAQDLATSLRQAVTKFGTPAVDSATASARQAAAVAQDAEALVTQCPSTVPEYCASVARHAGMAGDAATAAADSAQATTQLAGALSSAADSAGALAGKLAQLSKGAASLTDAAARASSGAAGVASGAQNLATAAHRVDNQAAAVAGKASGLASALAHASDGSTGPDKATRDETLAKLDAAASAPGKDSVTRIVVRTEPDADVTAVEHRLRPLRGGVEFQTQAQLASAIQDQLDTFELIDSIMRVISLAIAAITVVIITYVDLTNRRRQIGIERAIGIRSAAIVGSYVVKSLVTALIGTILGWLLFRLAIMPFVARHPFQFPSGPVTLEMVTATARSNAVILLVVAALAALAPAVRAVRMRILDAIWGT